MRRFRTVGRHVLAIRKNMTSHTLLLPQKIQPDFLRHKRSEAPFLCVSEHAEKPPVEGFLYREALLRSRPGEQ